MVEDGAAGHVGERDESVVRPPCGLGGRVVENQSWTTSGIEDRRAAGLDRAPGPRPSGGPGSRTRRGSPPPAQRTGAPSPGPCPTERPPPEPPRPGSGAPRAGSPARPRSPPPGPPAAAVRALAEMMAVGGDHLVHVDELREDEAGAELRAVAEVMAPTTAGQLMRRLNARQCQAAVAELAKIAEDVDGELGSDGVRASDAGSGLQRHRSVRQAQAGSGVQQPRPAFIRQPDGDLGGATTDRGHRAALGHLTDHPTAIKVLRRALRALPQDHGSVRARIDSGFESVPSSWS